MTGTYLAWGIAAIVMVALAVLIGLVITHHPLGLLIDTRGRYSLTQTQLTLWTITILSLVVGVFIGRWLAGTAPLTFDIPGTVLGAMGIAIGSTVAATAQNAYNANDHPDSVAASAPIDGWRPRLSQIFLAEQGPYADQVVDPTKFQNFVITVVVLLAYISLAVSALSHAGTPGNFTSLPDLTGALLVLLGVSHGGYLAGKLPTPADATGTLNVQGQRALAKALALPPDTPNTKSGGGLWSRPTVTYADGSPAPKEVPVGTAVIVTATQQFGLGVVATPPAVVAGQAQQAGVVLNAPPAAAAAVYSYVASTQVASGQWAAVVPPTSLPPVGGALELQVRYPVHDQINPMAGLVDGFPVPQTIKVTTAS